MLYFWNICSILPHFTLLTLERMILCNQYQETSNKSRVERILMYLNFYVIKLFRVMEKLIVAMLPALEKMSVLESLVIIKCLKELYCFFQNNNLLIAFSWNFSFFSEPLITCLLVVLYNHLVLRWAISHKTNFVED